MSVSPKLPRRGIPQSHPGSDYKSFSSQISRKRGSKLYLEIGVQNGIHLSTIHAERAIGVDPDLILSVNVAANKKVLELHGITSDAFFAGIEASHLGHMKLDLAFLDGFHTFEFLLRDFYHVERHAARNALIMMHDCLPLNAEMADRNETRSIERGRSSKFPSFWTGDVWKIIPILQKYRPDLRIVCVDCAPTGLVCVTNLDPSSTLLEDRYLDIVAEMITYPNDLAAITGLYDTIEMVSSSEILRDQDHSLYFRL